ncbi:MAG: saccharopine dehydrogenase NADP-binding domain-containing protein, partial [Candidatus Marinimicrobia bacterium]|nr:saccharopine dehydrogenase NADP-binding domain-containing protein [Candidatus Neomarinimicrobiota bacterium]
MKRDFQIVLWGATGFTGQIVAEYLNNSYRENLRWAIGGRSREKLLDLKARLALADNVEILVGDSFDENSLQEITTRTDVVISTVGPYALYGHAIVSACVVTQTDYCDLTGEVPFVKDSIDRFHDKALQNKVKIVHSCGYDSIPSDIGCMMLQEHAIKKYGKPFSKVKLYVLGVKGKPSGGTIASMINLIKEAKNPEKRSIQTNPYALCPASGETMPKQNIQSNVRFDSRIAKWTAPFIMARFNSRIVFRTNALLQYRYGKDFLYDEALICGRGFKGKIRGIMLMTGIWLAILLMKFSITRWVLQKTVLPSPGQGPSKDQRESGFFKVKLVGEDQNKRVDVNISDSNDPGYGSTSRMLAESALCLA